MRPAPRRRPDGTVPRCADCDSARHAAGTLRCFDGLVNVGAEAFLAGLDRAARPCSVERRNAVGECGRFGLRFVPRATLVPAAILEAPWPAPRAGIDQLDV